MPATWLIPMAIPRSCGGKASVRMAVELAKRKAPPIPWMMRKAMSWIAATFPWPWTKKRRIDPTVKTAKPAL